VSEKPSVRNRNLTQDEAFEEYLVYQIRLFEYMQMFQIELDIVEGRYQPSVLGHARAEFATTVRNYLTGIFASLMDKQGEALNVFDVWAELYPEDRKAEIVRVWKAIEPNVKTIMEFRNNVSFHINKSLAEYLKVRGDFYEKRREVVKAMQEFLSLAATLMKAQSTIPDFEARLDRTLKKKLPDESPEKLQRLKEYFIVG
jgi:hypothetical protein